MKFSLVKKIFLSAIIGIALSPVVVFAQPNAFPNEAWTPQDVVNLIGLIRNFFLIAGVIAIVIFTIWAGMAYLTSGGNEQKVKEAKKRMLWTIVGIMIVLSTYAIISSIRAFLAKDWF